MTRDVAMRGNSEGCRGPPVTVFKLPSFSNYTYENILVLLPSSTLSLSPTFFKERLSVGGQYA